MLMLFFYEIAFFIYKQLTNNIFHKLLINKILYKEK